MLVILFTLLFAAFASAIPVLKIKEDSEENRRLLFTTALLGWAAYDTYQASTGGTTTTQHVQKSSKKKKRRRRIGLPAADPVCLKVYSHVRDSGALNELTSQVGGDNRPAIHNGVQNVLGRLQNDVAMGDDLMRQGAFYLTVADHLDDEMLSAVMLNAYGTSEEQHQGCGFVVNTVNGAMAELEKYPGSPVRREEVDDEEVWMTTDAFRRLTGAMAVAGGTVLASICRGFDTETNNLITENYL